MAQAMCHACCWLHCYHAPASCLMQAHSQRSHRLQAPPSCLMHAQHWRFYRLFDAYTLPAVVPLAGTVHPNPSSTIITSHVASFCSGPWPSSHQVVGCQLT